MVNQQGPAWPRSTHKRPACFLPADTGIEAEGYHHAGGVKEKLKAAWHDVKEITPGTKVCRGAGGYWGDRWSNRPAKPYRMPHALVHSTRRTMHPLLPALRCLQEHREEYGTGAQMGGYRSTLGKR